MFTGIEHLAIASSDPKRLAEWYVLHLSFRLIHEDNGTFFVKAPDGSIVEIIPAEGDRGPNTMRSPGIRHIAISVANLDAAYDELKSKSIKFQGRPYENQGNRIVFFEDADGNLLHLIERNQPLPD